MATNGLQNLKRETDEQFLDDGGHFERSSLYHALAYEDLLDLINLVASYPEIVAPLDLDLTNKWLRLAPKMGGF